MKTSNTLSLILGVIMFALGCLLVSKGIPAEAYISCLTIGAALAGISLHEQSKQNAKPCE